MISKLPLRISFSPPLHCDEHKTLSTVSFSIASDTNYYAFALMSPERGFEDTRTHPLTQPFTNRHKNPTYIEREHFLHHKHTQNKLRN